MTPITPLLAPAGISETIGKLCVGGDWACEQGDFSGLRYVAEQLADLAPEPLHCEIVDPITACSADPARAATLWDRLKCRLYRDECR